VSLICASPDGKAESVKNITPRIFWEGSFEDFLVGGGERRERPCWARSLPWPGVSIRASWRCRDDWREESFWERKRVEAMGI
jgi:hypothetical protein